MIARFSLPVFVKRVKPKALFTPALFFKEGGSAEPGVSHPQRDK